jgi:hypothetical protein
MRLGCGVQLAIITVVNTNRSEISHLPFGTI